MRWQYFDYSPHTRIYSLLDGSTIKVDNVIYLEQCGDLHRLTLSDGQIKVLTDWVSWRIQQ